MYGIIPRHPADDLRAVHNAVGVHAFLVISELPAGRRDKVLVVRPTDQGTRTFNLNLQDKNLLSSEAYFLLPNDVVIVEPVKQKIFNQNLPTISFSISTFTGVLTTTLLLINYFGNQ